MFNSNTIWQIKRVRIKKEQTSSNLLKVGLGLVSNPPPPPPPPPQPPQSSSLPQKKQTKKKHYALTSESHFSLF